jgi:hypothetical protein
MTIHSPDHHIRDFDFSGDHEHMDEAQINPKIVHETGLSFQIPKLTILNLSLTRRISKIMLSKQHSMPLFLLEDENEEEELSVAKSPSIINATNL